MASTASFIRNSDIHLQEYRQGNLHLLSEQYGHGFQALLTKLMEQLGGYISPSEVSNLVNASKNQNGSYRSIFLDQTARNMERALDFPMSSLDLPTWHFQKNIDYFWQYAARASADREWFDQLLSILLDVPANRPTTKNESPSASTPVPKLDLAAIRERLQKKQATRV